MYKINSQKSVSFSYYITNQLKSGKKYLQFQQKLWSRDFFDDTVDKNPPPNAGNMGLISGLWRFHMLRSNKVHVPQLLSQHSRACKPQLLSLCVATTEACTP